MKTTDKIDMLYKQLNIYAKEDVMIAFSGGVDSSLLLKIICQQARVYGTRVYAVTAHTKLHPMNDLKIARRVAKEAGAIHKVITVDELEEAGIGNNPQNRCYLCKKCIFNKVKKLACELGIKYIIEGTNEDDMHQYRPGIKALRELGIISPLSENGLTKKEIRQMAAELDISVADRPSSPCLATRLPYGDKLDYNVLHKIDKGEKYLRELGFYNVRLRVHGNIARIEIDDKDISEFINNRQIITEYIKNLGFDYVTLDMEGYRSGSMDIFIR